MLSIKTLTCLALVHCVSSAAVPATLEHYYIEFSNSNFQFEAYTGSNNASSTVFLDTGSYNLYVNNYNYSNSTSVKELRSFTDYVSGPRQGEWVQDVVWFDEHAPEIPIQFGVDDSATSSYWGVFGVARGNAQPNYIQQLHLNGLINKGAFSTWYDKNTSHGEISLGTYDKAKYQGPLANFVSPSGSFWTATTGGIVTPDGNAFFQNQTILFDTGNEQVTIPEADLRAIQKSLNGSTYEEDGHYISYPKCQFTEDQKLSFLLGELVIDINLRDISYNYDGKCALLLGTTSQSPPTFGSPFLSSVFTIFDIDTYSVQIGVRAYTDEVDLQVIE